MLPLHTSYVRFKCCTRHCSHISMCHIGWNWFYLIHLLDDTSDSKVLLLMLNKENGRKKVLVTVTTTTSMATLGEIVDEAPEKETKEEAALLMVVIVRPLNTSRNVDREFYSLCSSCLTLPLLWPCLVLVVLELLSTLPHDSLWWWRYYFVSFTSVGFQWICTKKRGAQTEGSVRVNVEHNLA